MSEARYRIVVCRGPNCGDRRGSMAIYEALVAAVKDAQLGHRVELAWQSCFGRCRRGPNLLVEKRGTTPPVRSFVLAPAPRRGRGVLYNFVEPSDAADIVAIHIGQGRPVRRLIERAKTREPWSDVAEVRVVKKSEGES